MATNTNLTREVAVRLIRGEEVPCPACGQAVLTSRYGWKNQNVEYKCTACGEIYHPTKAV